MYDINFLAYAIDLNDGYTYENFLIPFLFFCLLHNKNSHVEIIVLEPYKFKNRYQDEINYIKKINNNFLIRKPQYKINNNNPNTYRFFESPTVKSQFTYISDVDIMYLEEILPKYLNTWPQNLPYHNIVRPLTNRLSGLIMVKNNEYYTKEFLNIQKKIYDMNINKNDEMILYDMCKEVHGLPDYSFTYRSIFGIHFSPNRGLNKKMMLKVNKKYKDKFMNISEMYPELFKYKIFSNLLEQLMNDFIIC